MEKWFANSPCSSETGVQGGGGGLNVRAYSHIPPKIHDVATSGHHMNDALYDWLFFLRRCGFLHIKLEVQGEARDRYTPPPTHTHHTYVWLSSHDDNLELFLVFFLLQTPPFNLKNEHRTPKVQFHLFINYRKYWVTKTIKKKHW